MSYDCCTITSYIVVYEYHVGLCICVLMAFIFLVFSQLVLHTFTAFGQLCDFIESQLPFVSPCTLVVLPL